MLTLQEYKDVIQDKVDTNLIDELTKSNALLNALTFDDTAVSTGGRSFPYVYHRIVTESGAEFRHVGEDYTPSDAKTEKVTSEVAIMGGQYSIDRAIAHSSKDSFIDQVELQSKQKIKAVSALFNDAAINGNRAVNDDEFDGLDVILKGSDTEYTSEIDVSTSALLDENYTAFSDELDGVMAQLDGPCDFICGNTKSIQKVKAMAKRLGQYQETKDDAGRTVSKYGGAELMDMGAKLGSNNPVISIDEDGKTDLYFIRLGMDGFHGITLKNGELMDIVMPEFSTKAETHAEGLVEMYAGVVLKKTKAAAVLRGVKVK